MNNLDRFQLWAGLHYKVLCPECKEYSMIPENEAVEGHSYDEEYLYCKNTFDDCEHVLDPEDVLSSELIDLGGGN